MKKIIALLLVLTLVIALASCTPNDNGNENKKPGGGNNIGNTINPGGGNNSGDGGYVDENGVIHGPIVDVN